MSVIKANELLEKYWAAETSIEEENELKKYHQEGLLQGLPEGDLFDYFQVERSIKSTREIGPIQKTPKMFGWRSIMSIAASVLIVASLFINNMNNSPSHKVIDDPEKALEVTMTALSFLNGSIDRGEDALIEGLQEFDRTRIFKYRNLKEI